MQKIICWDIHLNLLVKETNKKKYALEKLLFLNMINLGNVRKSTHWKTCYLEKILFAQTLVLDTNLKMKISLIAGEGEQLLSLKIITRKENNVGRKKNLNWSDAAQGGDSDAFLANFWLVPGAVCTRKAVDCVADWQITRYGGKTSTGSFDVAPDGKNTTVVRQVRESWERNVKCWGTWCVGKGRQTKLTKSDAW